MVLILDQHLDKLQCSVCQKYLSVFPVKVYKDGAIKCGRCTKPNDGGVTSLYEVIAKHCLFKCINRYEGCRKLLLASEVPTHEATCTSKKYTCPNCNISLEMPPFEILQHFKISHSKNFLTSNRFCLSLSKDVYDRKSYCYVQDDIIFIILLQYVPDDKCLLICAVTLGEMKDVNQHCIISTDTVPLFKQITVTKKCVSMKKFNFDHYYKINVSNILIQAITVEVILNSLSVHSYDVEMVSVGQNAENSQSVVPMYNLTACGTALYSSTKRIELTCSNCKQMMASKVFNCQFKKHLVCWDCKDWCGICECAISGRNSEVSVLSESLLFPCKWKCGAKIPGNDLRNHHLFCDMNKQKCPICNIVIVTKNLKIHFNLAHECKFVDEFILTEFFRLLSTKNCRCSPFYFMKNDSLFKLYWSKCRGDKLKIVPCDDTSNLKLFLITNNGCKKISREFFTVDLKDNPKLYIKF